MMEELTIKKKGAIISIIVVLLLTFISINSRGKELPTNNKTDIEVNTILMNQRNKKVSYFDINSNSKKTRKLKLRVKNKSSHPKQITLKVNNATTTDNGMVNYSNLGKNINTKNNLDKFIDKKERFQKIQLKGKESKLITINIKPQINLVGDLLGGVDISEKIEYKKNKQNLENIIHYTNAIYIHGKEYDEKPPVLFNNTKYNNKNLSINIINNSPVLINHLKINYTLKDKKGQIVSQNFQEEKKISPRGDFNYSIYEDSSNLDNEIYYLNLNMLSGNNKWTTNKKIEILNNRTITSEINPINRRIILATFLIFFIIIIIFVIKKVKKTTPK